MLVILSSGLSGLRNQSAKLAVIANNLANVSTTGFKKSRIESQDAFYQNVGQGQIGYGVSTGAIDKLFTQGSTQLTGNNLDLSIEGEGFFQLAKPDGSIVFTRDGAFKVDGQGRIVNHQGYILSAQINIPQDSTSIVVSGDGAVSVSRPGAQVPQLVGRIQLTKFANPQGLVSLGGNTFEESANSGAPVLGTAGQAGLGTLQQGLLEMSNVDMVDELTSMMLAQRAYQANLKVIKAGDEMFAATINMLK